MPRPLPLHRRDGQASLIGLLVVIAIIMVVVYVIWLKPQANQPPPRFEGEAQTTLGRAMQKGESVECRNNLSQLRSSLQMEQMNTEQFPAALSPSWGVALKCPVSGYAYQYNPQTGQVWCSTPGHEKY